jgi:hypothetical protein
MEMFANMIQVRCFPVTKGIADLPASRASGTAADYRCHHVGVFPVNTVPAHMINAPLLSMAFSFFSVEETFPANKKPNE